MAAPGRARSRIAIAAGRRAGDLGRRTLAVVVTEEERLGEDLAVGNAAMFALAAQEPDLVDGDQIAKAIDSGDRHLIVGLALSEGHGQAIAHQIEAAVSHVGAAGIDVRLITDGTAAAKTVAQGLLTIGAARSVPEARATSWEIFGVEQAGAEELSGIVNGATVLRALGTGVRVYGTPETLPHWSSLPVDKSAGLLCRDRAARQSCRIRAIMSTIPFLIRRRRNAGGRRKCISLGMSKGLAPVWCVSRRTI